MQDDRHHARVRQIPIRVEPRRPKDEEPVDGSHNYHCNDQQAFNAENSDYQGENLNKQSYPSDKPQYSNNHRYNTYSSNTLPNTSSININYKPTPPQRQNRAPSPNLSHGINVTDFYGNPCEQQQHPEQYQCQDRYESNQAASHPNVSQSNKENKNLHPKAGKNTSLKSHVSNNSDKLVNSPEPIPLPPPPELQHGQAREKSENSRRPNDLAQDTEGLKQDQDQNQQQQDTAENKRPKKDTGPQGVINSTRAEVKKLFKEVIQFNGTSLKDREYLLLDELLTRCMIRLDNIQCSDAPELRLQRKSVIDVIHKCTDIIQRKVQLNTDIQQLMINFS